MAKVVIKGCGIRFFHCSCLIGQTNEKSFCLLFCAVTVLANEVIMPRKCPC